MIWSTLYGGSNQDFATTIKCDTNGNIFVGGNTNSKDFPLQNNGLCFYDTLLNDTASASNHYDAFLLKFSNNGTRIFSTLLGGKNDDYANDLAIDKLNGNVAIVGATFSSNFPTQNGGGFFQNNLNGIENGFISLFNNNGGMLWSSYFGGNKKDISNSVSIDINHNIFMVGSATSSSQFSLMNNGTYYDWQLDSIDYFITKFNTAHNLIWSTFYGGSSVDIATRTAIDPVGNLYVLGVTNSNNFPVYKGSAIYFDSVFNRGIVGTPFNKPTDIGLLKFDNNGNRLWATYDGGNNYDGISNYINYATHRFDGLTVDNCGNVYVCFYSASSNDSMKIGGCNSYYQNFTNNNNSATFLHKFSRAGALVWGTYIGSYYSSETDLTLNNQNDLFVAYSGSNNNSFWMAYNAPFSYFNTYQGNILLNRFNHPSFSSGVNYSMCSAGCIGRANIITNASCAQSKFEFVWSNGNTTNSDSNLCAGNYFVIIKDTSVNCSSDTLHFNLHHGIQIFPVQSSYSCLVTCNGNASINLPAMPIDSIIWNTTDTTYKQLSSINNLCPGNDTVIVKVNGCGSDTVIFNIPQTPYLTITLNGKTNASQMPCPIKCNGTASVIMNGGASNHPSCIWSNGVVGTYVNNLCAGQTYIVTATDSVCYTTQISISEPPALQEYVTTYSSHNDSGCIRLGYAYATMYNAHYPVKYKWSNGDSTYSVNYLHPGVYYCIVSDSCYRDSVSFTIPSYPVSHHIIGQLLSVQLPCDSFTCDGKIRFQFSPSNTGVSPYKIYWNGVLSNSYSLDSVCPFVNNYIKITDACGDTLVDSIAIGLDAMSFGIGVNLFTCLDSCKGSAYITSITGRAPFKFYWKNTSAIFDSGTVCNHLCADSFYYVYGYDVCGKRAIATITFPRPPNLFLTLQSTTTCAGLCLGTANVSNPTGGGVPPYTFQWSTGFTGNTIYNLCLHQKVYCTMTDACGTSITDSIVIQPNATTLGITMGSSPSCTDNCNGVAYAYPVAGYPPYTYTWNGGGYGPSNYQFACAGHSYTCTITDQCGASATDSVTIQSLTPLSANVSLSNTNCNFNCNAHASVNYSGGASPYFLAWSNGWLQVNQVNNLCADSNYFCIVSSIGCTSKKIKFHVPANIPLKAKLVFIDSSCSNSCNGKLKVLGSGGIAPYTYLWSNAATTPLISNLCAGNYTCIVSDGCGKHDTINFTMTAQSIPKAVITILSASCSNFCSAKAKVKSIGGKPPYTYHWSNGSHHQVDSSLCIGNNFCFVIDSCGNRDTTFFVIAAKPLPIASITINSPSCSNSCNGNATANGSNGTLPYSYHWSNGNTNQTANNLCVGNNFCIVSDSCGNIDTAYCFITAYSSLNDSVFVISKSCLNTCNGSAYIHTQGSIAPYTYLWSNGATTPSTNSICTGNNFCIITDGCGKHDTLHFVIDTIPHLSQTIISTASACKNICTGSASVSVTGGLSPISYQWSNGAITSSLYNLCPGIYTLIVSNAFCINDSLFDTIVIASTFQSSAHIISNVTCFDSCNAIAQAQASGGIQPYVFSWSNGATTAYYNKFCADTFVVAITDNVGCKTFDTIFIHQPLPLKIDTTNIPSHCFNKDGEIIAQASGGIKPYSYVWSNGVNTNNNFNIAQGNYLLTISDSNHCKFSQNFYLNGLYPRVQTAHDTIVGAGSNVLLTANGTQHYRWIPTTYLNCDTCKNVIWNSIYQQNICVIGIDTWGCSDTACFTIYTIDDCNKIVLPKAFSPNNDGNNDEFKPLTNTPICFVQIDFRIFDRWGNLVFQSNDINKAWDGNFKGQPMPIDVYVWVLNAENYFGKKIELSGNVTLIK